MALLLSVAAFTPPERKLKMTGTNSLDQATSRRRTLNRIDTQVVEFVRAHAAKNDGDAKLVLATLIECSIDLLAEELGSPYAARLFAYRMGSAACAKREMRSH